MSQFKMGYSLTGFLKNHVEIVVANLVCILLAISSWNYYDVRYFLEWYAYFSTGRLLYVYASSIYDKIAYPPLPVLIFVSVHHVAVSLTGSIEAIRLIDKLPLIISFNAIYFVLRKQYGRKAGMLWLMNIAGYIIISGYQFDIIAALFLLLGYVELSRGDLLKSTVYLTLAALVKQVLAVLILIPLLIRLKNRDYKGLLHTVSIAAAVGLVFITPFLLTDAYAFIRRVLFFHAARYPQELSLFALPLYASWYNVNAVPAWLVWIWVIPLAIYTLVIYFYFLKEPEYDEKIFLKYFITLLIGLLVFNKIGGFNYFTWLVPFLVIYAVKNPLHSDNHLFETLYVSIPIMSSVIYYASTLFAAAVASSEIFMIEDLNWVSAEEVILRSTSASSLLYTLVQACRSNPLLNILFGMLNQSKPVSQIFFTILYNAYLTYILKEVLATAKTR
uniref:DUF2029 domain-containing protein n=1 Tax=Thermosphaera aggregans TaxID=54254 RepID=A0A7C2FHJ4_9CREN